MILKKQQKLFLQFALKIVILNSLVSCNTKQEFIPKDRVISDVNYDIIDNNYIDSLLTIYPYDDLLISVKALALIREDSVDRARNFIDVKFNENNNIREGTFYNWIEGTLALKDNDNKSANSFFDISLSKDVDNINGWVRLEKYYNYKETDIELAKGYLAQAIDIFPNYVYARMEVSNILRDEKKYKEALLVLDSILSERKMPYVINNKGAIFFEMGKLSEAENCFLEANSILENQISLMQLGNISFQKQEYEKSEKYYLRAIEIGGSVQSYVYSDLAFLYGKTFRLNEAYVFQKEALKLDNSQDNISNMIWINILLENYDEAYKYINIMRDDFGKSYINDYWEILCLVKDGKLEQGRTKIKDFVKNNSPVEVEYMKKDLNSWGIDIKL